MKALRLPILEASWGRRLVYMMCPRSRRASNVLQSSWWLGNVFGWDLDLWSYVSHGQTSLKGIA